MLRVQGLQNEVVPERVDRWNKDAVERQPLGRLVRVREPLLPECELNLLEIEAVLVDGLGRGEDVLDLAHGGVERHARSLRNGAAQRPDKAEDEELLQRLVGLLALSIDVDARCESLVQTRHGDHGVGVHDRRQLGALLPDLQALRDPLLAQSRHVGLPVRGDELLHPRLEVRLPAEVWRIEVDHACTRHSGRRRLHQVRDLKEQSHLRWH
mmetsp:Transcript_30425/g.77461  ORF Transcript_30425/g.77461 Transcript_30425/m.77461 type:complete len:211 (+) Transcript_30425:1071-1703(+)